MSSGCPIRAACVRRSGREPGGLGARQLRPRPARRPALRQRLARLPVSARPQQPAVRLRELRRRLPVRHLQPAGERLHRLRLPSGVREERPASTPCTANARMGNPATPNFIPPGFTPKDVTYHNVITEWHATEPGGEYVRGHEARAAARGAHRREPHAPDGQRRVQPDREARHRPTTACSTRAAAISGSATAADRTPTIPARRSGSTRSSPPSCGSIRAVRP